MRQEATVRIEGTGRAASAVGWEVEAVELDDGETQVVRVTFDFWELTAQVDFTSPERAEQFLDEFRDGIVEAKRGELEWRSETDTEEANGDD